MQPIYGIWRAVSRHNPMFQNTMTAKEGSVLWLCGVALGFPDLRATFPVAVRHLELQFPITWHLLARQCPPSGQLTVFLTAPLNPPQTPAL